MKEKEKIMFKWKVSRLGRKEKLSRGKLKEAEEIDNMLENNNNYKDR